MCGRYAARKDPAALAAEFDAVNTIEDHTHRADYNVAPTKKVVAVVQRHPHDEEGVLDLDRTERSLRLMRWGLVPAWAKDVKTGAKMINARVESAATKPAFRTSMAKRRCLLPADGWFEWRKDGSTKQPFFMTTRDGSSLAFAGLWTTWRDKSDPDAPLLVTCAVLTTDAVGQLTSIHERMPLLLGQESWASWLNPDTEDVSALPTTSPLNLVESLELRPVSPAVNSVRNNGPELIARYEPAPDLDDPVLFDPGQGAGR